MIITLEYITFYCDTLVTFSFLILANVRLMLSNKSFQNLKKKNLYFSWKINLFSVKLLFRSSVANINFYGQMIQSSVNYIAKFCSNDFIKNRRRTVKGSLLFTLYGYHIDIFMSLSAPRWYVLYCICILNRYSRRFRTYNTRCILHSLNHTGVLQSLL